MFSLLLLLAVGFSHAAMPPVNEYFMQGNCQSDKVCKYNFVVDQQYFDGDAQQNITISAKIGISCHSVGLFSGKPASQFCMTVSETMIEGDMFSEKSDTEMKYHRRAIDQLLSGWFCFVQADSGKILAVHHAAEESDEAVDLKKSVAAAFQANFEGTRQEEEDDPQSGHIAHYRYDKTSDRVKKMHRSVKSGDVIEYSTGARKRDIKLNKEEDIEYRDGYLYHSSGDTSLKFKTRSSDESQHSLSDAFSARGSYTLDLEECYVQSEKDKTRQRRSLNDRMTENMKEEGLKVNYNMTHKEVQRLISIRKRMPSITQALAKLHANVENTKLIDELELLLELEYKFGTPTKLKPAIQDVLSYYEKIRDSKKSKDKKMCEVIFGLLSAEGSLVSQLRLIEALQDATTEETRDMITIEISTIANPHIEFVRSVEQQLQDESQHVIGLLLAFGALAANAEPTVEYEVATFLIGLHNTLVSGHINDTSRLTHLILAMGNTGSVHVLNEILAYIDSPVKDVQQSSIRALLKFTHLKVVTRKVAELLDTVPDEDTVILITRTLVKGHMYSTGLDIEINPDVIYPLVQSLPLIALRYNNTDLMMLVSAYLQEAVGKQNFTVMINKFKTVVKRAATSDWDSTSSSEYNLVASQSQRSSDTSSYPRHKAYIYGKTLGISEANLKAGAGVFFGLSNDCDNLKGFGKVYATGTVLSESRDLADIEILLQKTGTTLSGSIQAEIGGNTLVSRDLNSLDASSCVSYTTPLTRSRYRLFSFTHSIFVYVGTIDVGIGAYLGLSINFDAEACASISVNNLASGTAAIVPQISFSIEGSASASLLLTVRAGITAAATFVYQVEPRSSAKVCTVSCQGSSQACAGLYHSWPGNSLDLYAWYQTRSVNWCGSWIRYQCGFSWGSRHRWSAFDYSWSLGSSSRRALYERCYPSSSPTCSASPAET